MRKIIYFTFIIIFSSSQISIAQNDSTDIFFDTIIYSSYTFKLSNKINLEPAGMLVIPNKGNINYYLSASFTHEKIIGIGLNYKKDVFGVQISTPKIANILKIGFNLGFYTGNALISDQELSVFGNADFKSIKF